MVFVHYNSEYLSGIITLSRLKVFVASEYEQMDIQWWGIILCYNKWFHTRPQLCAVG